MEPTKEWLPPHRFKVGDVLYVPGYFADGPNHLWLYIGGARCVMDMNSGYTLPTIDANRWLKCKKLEGVRIKSLHFIPESSECDITISVKPKNTQWSN
jgi:hypothetical protein